MKSVKFLMMLSLALVISCASYASALTISGLFSGNGAINALTDDSAEWLINANGTYASAADSKVETGDRIRAIFQIDHINGTAIGSGTVYNEFTGIVDLTATVTGNQTSGFDYYFTPTPKSLSGFTYDNSFVEMYEDSSKDFTRLNLTKTEMESVATNGTLRFVAGIGNNTDFWTAHTQTNDILAIQNISYPLNGGVGNMGLSIFYNGFPGLTVLRTQVDQLGNAHDMLGSTSFLGTGGQNTSADIFDNTDFALSTVPEPATMVLFGFGLLALAGVARRKKA